MSDHTFRQYDVELENIRTRVLQMGGYVEQQVIDALRSLTEGNATLAERVINNDTTVNRLEIELDDACTQIIAKRQPTASDLRSVLSVLHAVTDLERVGDEAKKIAKVASGLYKPGHPGITPEIQMQHLGKLAVESLRKSLDAMARLDLQAASEVVTHDATVDLEFKSVMRQLITWMMEDPRTISSFIDILFAAKSMERIGDHAKNIAQHVVFLVQGQDVRHLDAESLQQITSQQTR